MTLLPRTSPTVSFSSAGWSIRDRRCWPTFKGGEDPPGEVEILVTFRVADAATVTVVSGDGLLAVEGRPGWEYPVVADAKLFVASHWLPSIG